MEKKGGVIKVGGRFVRSTISVLGEADQLGRMDELQVPVVTWELKVTYIRIRVHVTFLGLIVYTDN